MHKNRLAKLEADFNRVHDIGVLFVDVDENGNWVIPKLNFTGSIDDGRRLIANYPNSPVIIDDIPED